VNRSAGGSGHLLGSDTMIDHRAVIACYTGRNHRSIEDPVCLMVRQSMRSQMVLSEMVQIHKSEAA